MLSNEELEREIERAKAIANICAKAGEADGQNAAASQLRALEAELRGRLAG